MRQMQEKDIGRVSELVTGYLKKFPLHPEFTSDEVAHWMLPRDGVVYSYVRENGQGEVTDVCSFYSLASTVPLHELMLDALILAKKQDFDVFNALNVMENESFLKELKFGIGDGFLQYYLYNWKCPKIEPCGIGLVLL